VVSFCNIRSAFEKYEYSMEYFSVQLQILPLHSTYLNCFAVCFIATSNTQVE